jgi:hypothetical protein
METFFCVHCQGAIIGNICVNCGKRSDAVDNSMNPNLTVEQILERHLKMGGYVTPAERQFIKDMRTARANDVGYGWMKQVINWEWEHADHRQVVYGASNPACNEG